MKAAHTRAWLVVEDDENDFILMRRALRRADPDARLHWVRDGGEAKNYLQTCVGPHPTDPVPSVIISDLKMPRCTGLELVQWVRSDARLGSVPFIMFSSSDEPADVALAYEDGANWYLAKPASYERLVEMLVRLTDNLSVSVWEAGSSSDAQQEHHGSNT
jgi:CheY-like chemotaxis protein